MIPHRITEHLTAYARMAKEPVRYWRRKKYSIDGYGPPWFIPSSVKKHYCGYYIGGWPTLNGSNFILEPLQRFAKERIASLDIHTIIATRMIKPFYFSILAKQDISEIGAMEFSKWPDWIEPALLGYAVGDSTLRVLCPYYGLLPELSHMGLFVSGFGEPWTDASKPLGTQCLHRDNWDRKHVKVFVNLTDVTEDDGPLCLLPADVSTWLMKKTGHYWNCKPYRDDSEWKRYVSDKDFVKVTGPSGTVAIVDTSACLHYGSRTRAGRQRQVFVIHYTEFSAYSDAVTGEYEDINLPTCPELAQGLTWRQKLVFRTI